MGQNTELNDVSARRSQMLKLVIASVVLVLCVGWLGFLLFFGGEPVNHQIDPKNPAEKFLMASVPVFANERFEHIHLGPADDGKSIVVSGKVKSQAELDELKKGLEAVEPKVELKWEQIRIGK